MNNISSYLMGGVTMHDMDQGGMIIICAWCDTLTGTKEGEGVTSTICPECKGQMLNPELTYNKMLKRFERKVAA